MNIFDLLIVQPIFNLLMGIYSIIPGGDFGIALILFTILVRFIMWPLAKKQIKQIRITRKIQPELARIKKAAKGNKQLVAMQTMELYKKHNISPFGAIGVLLLQLPIFIALFFVIRIFTDSRAEIGRWTYGFLENIPAIKALIDNPESFNHNLFGFIDITQQAITTNPLTISFGLVVIALGASVTQYVMSKQTTPPASTKKTFKEIMAEAAAGKDPDQSEINGIVMGKMMKFLPIMLFFIIINFPGALALYYMVSNLVAVIQNHFYMKKLDEEEATVQLAKAKTTTGKKATAKARQKEAKEAETITRITAKDTTNKRRK